MTVTCFEERKRYGQTDRSTVITQQSGRLVGCTRVSKRGRPALRQHACLFAVRSIRQGGLFRAEYEGGALTSGSSPQGAERAPGVRCRP